MAGKIAQTYAVLMAIVTDKLKIFTKADTKEFERIPAIGFGIPTIRDVDAISNSNKVIVTVPVVIADAGINPQVNLYLADLYESLRLNIETYISSYLTTATLRTSIDSIIFGPNFGEVPYNGTDPSIRCIGGEIEFIISL